MDISLDTPSGQFKLALPGGNHVLIPVNDRGLAILFRILSADAEAKRKQEAQTIGTDSSPVQYMVERWLVEDAKVKETKNAELLSQLDFEL